MLDRPTKKLEEPKQIKLPLYQTIASALTAGTCEIAAGHPMWVFKTRMQFGIKPTYGVAGLYTGVVSNVCTMAPLVAMRLTIGTTFQEHYFPNGELTLMQRVSSALVGGAFPCIWGSPLEFMRSIQQKNKLKSQTLFQATRSFVDKHGIFSLATGGIATAARDAVNVSGVIALAPIFNQKIREKKLFPADQVVLSYTASGIAAGVFAALLSQPIDAIKAKQQNELVTHNKNYSLGQATKQIYREQGLKGFNTGGLWRLNRVISGNAIIYLTDQMMRKYFQNKNEKVEAANQYRLK